MKVEKVIITTETHDIEIVGATLLSVEEARNLPLRLRAIVKCWWLGSPVRYSNRAEFVFNGSVIPGGCGVADDDMTVRPALQLKNLNSSDLKVRDEFIFGGRVFEVISPKLALCLEGIGNCAFRYDYKAADANDYEKSDVKKFVDEWFEEATK